MSTLPEKVIRVLAPFGSLASLLRNRDKVAADAPGKLTANDLVAVNGRGISLHWRLVAGLPVDHGTVADEAAMLSLHVDSAETPTPRWVVPGDSCLRTDDPGWRWHCIAGHGTTLADWERRPLGGALSGLAVSGHTHGMSDVSELADELDALGDEIASKQAALTNATALARLTASAGGPPLWDGSAWPGGSGGGSGGAQTSAALILAAEPVVYYSGAALLDGDGNAAIDGGEWAQATDLSGNGHHWIAPAGARPTLDADGCGGQPCMAFGGAAYATCTSGNVDLRDHTVVIVARSRATTTPYGRLLVLGLPADTYDYATPSAEVLTIDNTGSSEIRIDAGNGSHTVALTSADIGRPSGWGVYIYRAARLPALATVRARLAVNGVLSASTTSTYPTAGIGIHAGCQWRNGSAQPSTDVLRGDIALAAVLPRGMPDGWCDFLAALLRVELGI